MIVAVSVVAALAAALHVYIWVMESVQWARPAVWRRFGVADQAAADITKPMAYNQGFYNLFLAIGAALGVILLWTGPDLVGRTLVFFALGSMLAASIVLVTGGARYARPAAVQGTLPLIGILLLLFA